MNIDTGEVFQFDNTEFAKKWAELTEKHQRLVSLNQEPKESCRYCYGRGYEFVTTAGVHVPCRCTK